MDDDSRPETDMDPADHVMVTAALARLGNTGAWARLLEGGRPDGALDRADVDLVEAAGLLARDRDRYRPARDDWWLTQGTTMGHAFTAVLRRALQHASGGAAGWDGQDAQLVLEQGRGSARVADLLDELLAQMPAPRAAFRGGTGRFLDVGVGVAAISVAMCRKIPPAGRRSSTP